MASLIDTGSIKTGLYQMNGGFVSDSGIWRESLEVFNRTSPAAESEETPSTAHT